MISAKAAKFLSKIGIPLHNQTVKGDIDFNNVKNLTAPNAVVGNCSITRTTVAAWPHQMYVDGNLNLFGVNGKTNPSGMYVTGNLCIADSKIELPNRTTVEGNMNLMFSEVSKLPDDLIVKGTLDIRATNIIKIPPNAQIGAVIVDPQQAKTIHLPENFDKSKIMVEVGEKQYEPYEQHTEKMFDKISDESKREGYCVSVVGLCGLTNENEYKTMEECLSEVAKEHVEDLAVGNRIDILSQNGRYAASCCLSDNGNNIDVLYYENRNIQSVPLDKETVQEIQELQSHQDVQEIGQFQKEMNTKDTVELE